MTGESEAELTLASWPDVPDFTMRALRLGLGHALTVAGRNDVQVTGKRTPDGAVFSATWAKG